MGTPQLLLAIGGMVLLSFVIITFQNATSANYDTTYENEAIITATAIGQSVLEKVQVKAFDENTVSTDVSSTSQLSTTMSAETGESSEISFDDVDDYDAFADSIHMNRLGTFAILIDVYYISQSNPDQVLTSPTFSKRIDIQVSNPYLEDPVELNCIVSY